MKSVTRYALIEFEKEVVGLYLNKKIRSPVHLSGGNEDALIKIFKKIKKNDWVFSNHRSHYHALLKGISREWLIKEIIKNRSIHINNKRHKFFSSAIVGGNLPIALGAALALKLKKSANKVWVFAGDMAAETGIFAECVKYAGRNNLPVTFVVEDNGLSVNTPTSKSWGKGRLKTNIIKYKYKRVYPHQGCGTWINF
jgi:TPP-dependent pyruvate/acetoin dehydrogenase alpha subunit